MFKNFPRFTKQKKTSSEDSIPELLHSEDNSVSNIPEKYLNTNVRAMISGGIKEEPEKEYFFHLDTFFSFFKKVYRVEIKIFKEDT